MLLRSLVKPRRSTTSFGPKIVEARCSARTRKRYGWEIIVGFPACGTELEPSPAQVSQASLPAPVQRCSQSGPNCLRLLSLGRNTPTTSFFILSFSASSFFLASFRTRMNNTTSLELFPRPLLLLLLVRQRALLQTLQTTQYLERSLPRHTKYQTSTRGTRENFQSPR